MNKDDLLSIIVFSKDRPLQLHAYLESLLQFGGVTPSRITILYRPSAEIHYEEVQRSFPDCRWQKETSFSEDLDCALKRIDTNYLMFGCDDVVFYRLFDFSAAINALQLNPKILGATLRLGKNIYPCPTHLLKVRAEFLEWNWTVAPNHWGYPWELVATIYRTVDALRIINLLPGVKNPNFLEGNFYEYPEIRDQFAAERPLLTSFTQSKMMVITVNRVQDTHPNSFDARDDGTTPINLFQQYRAGFRLDVDRLARALPLPDIHGSSKHLRLRRAESIPHTIGRISTFAAAFHYLVVAVRYRLRSPFHYWRLNQR